MRGEGQGRPMLTVREAAAAAGVSADTIRRRLRAGQFPGAVLSDAWRIPAGELVAAGLHLHAPQGPQRGPAPASTADDELGALRAALAAVRADLAVARAQLEERDRALRLAEVALRALPPGPVPRRRWRRRRSGEPVEGPAGR